MIISNRTILAIASAALISGAGACTDESTVTPTSPKNYTPSTTGSFWVYETRQIDSAGTESTEISSRDSVVAGDTVTMGGETAASLVVHSNVGGNYSSDTTYTYTENAKVYNYISIDNYIPIPIPFEISEMWVNSVDFNASGEWGIFEQALPPMEVPMGLLTGDPDNKMLIKFTPKLVSKGKKGEIKQMVVQGQTMQTQEIITTTKVTLSKISAGPLTAPDITFDVVNKSYYADNIGPVVNRTEPTAIPLPLGFPTFHRDGMTQILVKHSIK